MVTKFSGGKTKFLVGGVLIAGVIGYLIYTGLRDTQMYYLTPSEVVEMGEEAYNEGMRIGGIVADGSIDWDPQTLLLEFRVEDDDVSLPVFYKGVVPDAFENGVEIVVEGKLTAAGVFEATLLLPKCPSKYEAAPSP